MPRCRDTGAAGAGSGTTVPADASGEGHLRLSILGDTHRPPASRASRGTSRRSRAHTWHLQDAFLQLLSAAGQGCGVLDATGAAAREACGTAGSIPGPAQLLPWQEPFGFLSDLSPCCFPSAVLFQHLIIYRGLCGQLYRGSYCLIELLDSSAAKIITRVKKRYPLEEQPGERAELPMVEEGSTHPGARAGLPGEVWGVHHPHPTSSLAPASEDCKTDSCAGTARPRSCRQPSVDQPGAGISPGSAALPIYSDAELRASPPAEVGNGEFCSIFPFLRGNPAPGSPYPFCH